MTDLSPDDRIRTWLLARDPGEAPETLRTSVTRVPYDVRRPAIARLAERRLPSAVPSASPLTRFAAWRSLGAVVVLALLLIGLVLGVLLVAGSAPRVPPPFGRAANGNVAYAAEGDLYTVDLVTGRSQAIVTGPETDTDPVWSLDGSRLVFRRSIVGEPGERLFVARADGSGIVLITPEPLSSIAGYAFSPDGRRIVVVSGLTGDVTIANSDGTGLRTLDVSFGGCVFANGCEPSFRPPDGAEIVLVGGANSRLYVVDATDSRVRILAVAPEGGGVIAPRWSPDGALIAYGRWQSARALTIQTHIVAADGTGDRVLEAPPGAMWNGRPVWSNDGTRLAIVRGYGPGHERDVLAVVSAPAGGRGIETAPSVFDQPIDIPPIEWAPDDTSILLTPFTAGRPDHQVFVDALTGRASRTPWATDSRPAWQRLAP
jgi:dipeptidyl aminopeptidase/acylaminoacyl peptidase